MPEENNSTKNKLRDISNILDEYLSGGDTDSGEIRFIDKWLGKQVSKIRIQRLKDLKKIPDEDLRESGENDFNTLDYQNLVFENLPGMDVFLFDKNYKYIFSGGKEKERFNKTNSDYLGKTMFEVFGKTSQRKLFPFYNKVLNGERTEGEVRLGNDVYYLVAVPVINPPGEVTGGIIISQNVTSDKLLEESLIKSKEKAQKADRAKSLFIANISHEIRTPLNSIIGFTEQLEKTGLDDGQTEMLNHVKNASEHLLSLVNEIVFLFKLGMDKVHIEKTPFPPHSLLNEISDLIRLQAGKKGLNFSFQKDPAIPPVILGDRFRLQQILMNLLVNAVKYTDRGSISLSCEIHKESRKGLELKFQVIDTGIGIKKKDLPHIFEVFEQGHNKIDRTRGGAGLGLGICKKLVDLLKGEIFVESKINQGSTFTVLLPFIKTKINSITEKERTYKLQDELLKNKKILIADDDPLIRRLAEMIMKGWKADFIIVTDGLEALDKLGREKFDIILLDIHMPGQNGEKVVRTIKNNKNHLNYTTPVISLTANALKSDINRYLNAGFDGYIIKPFKEAELYNKLCNMLQSVREGRPPDKKEIKINSEDIIFDVTELALTAGDDKTFFNDMIDEFTDGARQLIKTLNQSLGTADWQSLGEQAHKSIPSFRYFEVTNIAKILEEIENITRENDKTEKLPFLVNNAVKQTEKIISMAEQAKKDLTKDEDRR